MISIHSKGMHVVFIQHTYENYPKASDLLMAHFTTTEWAEALVEAGASVSVIYRFHSDDHLVSKGVNYYFLKDELAACLKWFHLPVSFTHKVRKFLAERDVDILHSHNLRASFPNLLLRVFCSQYPMVIQDHGAVPAGRSLRSRFVDFVLKWSLRYCDAVVFAAKGQELAWVERRLIKEGYCKYIMENSASFSFMPRRKARAVTGVQGAPVFLWVGNLDRNKDPITALLAFDEVFNEYPQARLYMIYRFDQMKSEVKEIIENRPGLRGRVELLGSKKRAELPFYYNSADYIISSSHKEAGGYSVIEAMACGVVPILSDIPSFQNLTSEGKVGAVFQAGSVKELTQKTLEVCQKDISIESEKVISHFKQYHSFEALAKSALNVYSEVISGRHISDK